MTDASLLEVKNLSVNFGTGDDAVRAVKNVSFDIKRGETLAVVGSSAISRRGSLISAMAIIVRWRIPPENSCG